MKAYVPVYLCLKEGFGNPTRGSIPASKNKQQKQQTTTTMARFSINHSDRLVAVVASTSLLLLFIAVDSCLAIKCIEPVRINAIDPPCTHPFVPETIYRDYDGKSCWAAPPPPPPMKEGYGGGKTQQQQQQQQMPSSDKNNEYSAHDDSHHHSSATITEACSFVAQAIYSHLPPIVDIVLLNNGMCNELINIEMGVFGPEDARDLLPYNNELIVLVLEGKEIVHALEHGMRDALEQGVAGAYPKTAGIRYDLAEENMVQMMMMEEEEVSHPPEKNHPRPLKGTSSKRRRLLSSYQVWGPSCTWEALEYHKLYTVLTNEFLAQGGDGYHMLHHKAKNSTSTGMREAEVFWHFAQSTCIVELPQRKQEEHDNVVETQVADHLSMMAHPVGTISGTTSSIRIQSH
jgi:hypothetical protein